MARLEIRDGDDKTTRVLRVNEDGEIEAEPADESWLEELENMYVVDPRDGKQKEPRDGDEWLYGLQVNYRGIYFRGVYVEE